MTLGLIKDSRESANAPIKMSTVSTVDVDFWLLNSDLRL